MTSFSYFKQPFGRSKVRPRKDFLSLSNVAIASLQSPKGGAIGQTTGLANGGLGGVPEVRGGVWRALGAPG